MHKKEAGYFDPVGLTPPRGRQGHSVPTPRPLGGGEVPFISNKLDSWATTDLQHSGSSSESGTMSPAQFYAHRDHNLGGSLSKLDRMSSHQDSVYMEAFDETEEYEGTYSDNEDIKEGRNSVHTLTKHQTDLGSSRTTSAGMLGGRGGGVTNMSLDKLTGDSLLFFSYSTALGGSGLNSDLQLGGSFVRAFAQDLNSSLNVPYLQSTSPGGGASSGDHSHLFPTVARNPNKAIITIDAQTSRILIANEMTCELFGYQRNDLAGMKIQNLFTEPYRGEQRALVEQNISASGETVLISGKVMDAVTGHGIEFPVSVWMRRIDTSTPRPRDTSSPCNQTPPTHTQTPPTARVIVVIEPVERSSALFSIDSSHMIASCDPWFACMFGFQSSEEVIGKPVNLLIPSLKLPALVEELPKVPSKQAVTGRAKGGIAFPLTVKFTQISQNSLSVCDLYSPTHSSSMYQTTQPSTDYSPSVSPSLSNPISPSKPTTPPNALPTRECSPLPDIVPDADLASSSSPVSSLMSSQNSSCINAKVVVYASLSGMISFFPDGTIHGCNHHFAIMLFGYSQQELIKKDITFLLPDFHQHVGCYVDDHNLPLPPLDEEDCLFHSVAERSLSPDKAFEFKKSMQYEESPRKKEPDLLSPGIQDPPLQSSDTMDISMGKASLVTTPPPSSVQTPFKEDITPNISDMLVPSSSSTPANSSTDVSSYRTLNSCDLESGSHDPIPHALPINGTDPSLPPVPNRLVPSQSTERIMEILNQHGLGTRQEDQETGSKEERLLSSTPAAPKPSRSWNSSEKFQLSQELDRSSLSLSSIPDGTFMGDARHKDGSLMAVVFQLKKISLGDGQDIHCMWLSRDLDMDRARTADLSMSMSRLPPDPYRQHRIISPEVDLGDSVDDTDGVAPLRRDSTSQQQQQQQVEELIAMEGEYSLSYSTLQPVGKGAFGFVRLAKKLDTKTVVVVKFLRKSSVLKDCWITDDEMGVVPLEIALLARLCHSNIVQLLEAYENEHFFQMVMEKHGEGLDLFEFIERSPKLNEAHVSYIFRQVISALAYLHGKNIIHRDIKDENIIIDEHFQVKLIDFGSAAYMAPDKLFNTFCGTLEYCSPEVLLGNSYSGPELEMWAVGVTLYTLVFGENPFFDVEETISGHLQPPFLTSPALMKVLFWLLHPDPRSRATIKDLLKDKWTNQTINTAQCRFEVVFGQVSGIRSDISSSGGGHISGNDANTGGGGGGGGKAIGQLIKSCSEGETVQLKNAMELKLVLSEKKEKKEDGDGGGGWC